MRGSGEVLERLRRASGEALERLWRASGRPLERLWRGSGEPLERLRRASEKAQERLQAGPAAGRIQENPRRKHHCVSIRENEFSSMFFGLHRVPLCRGGRATWRPESALPRFPSAQNRFGSKSISGDLNCHFARLWPTVSGKRSCLAFSVEVQSAYFP